MLQDDCELILYLALYLFDEEECKYVRDHLVKLSNTKTFFNKLIKYKKNNNKLKRMDFPEHEIEILNPFYKDENYKGWFPNSEDKYSICIKCGQILDVQKGFNETKKVHVCTNCGEALFNPLYDDKFKNKYVLWICDK